MEGYKSLKKDLVELNEDIGMPDMPYGWAKLTHEYLANLAYENYGIKSMVYGLFCVYREDQNLTYPFPAVFKRFVENNNKNILTMWKSANQMCDSIYISGCVNSVLNTINKIDDEDVLNLSTDIFINFKHFASLASNIGGYNPEVKGIFDKPIVVFARAGDPVK